MYSKFRNFNRSCFENGKQPITIRNSRRFYYLVIFVFSAIESPLLIAGFFIQLTVKQLRAILDKDRFNKSFLNQYIFKPKYTRKTTLV